MANSKDVRVRNDRLKSVQTPIAPPSYDDRIVAQLRETLGSRIYEARDAQTREAGSTQPFGDWRNQGYGDRYGTNGGARTGSNDDYNKPPRAEEVQRKQGIKGAEVGEYRSGPIGPDSVVQ